MLDRAAKLIARTDVDRVKLLFDMNSMRKGVLRDKEIPKFYQYLTDIAHTNGVVSLSTSNIKKIETLEWSNNGKTKELTKLTFSKAREKYPSFTVAGEPEHYIEIGTKITLLPVPVGVISIGDLGDFGEVSSTFDFGSFVDSGTSLTSFGKVNIYGMFWPADLTDSLSSTDITTEEIPEAWIYLAASEYFDFMDENAKGSYYRDKAISLIDQYISESNDEYNAGLDMNVKGYYS